MSLRRRSEQLLELLPKRIARYGYDIVRVVRPRGGASDCYARPLALLGSNDLSLSGAPRIVLEMTRALVEHGYRVVIVAMGDGAMREEFEAAGATVLIDVRPRSDSGYLRKLAQDADLAIVNTVVCAPLARAWAKHAPLIWYLHEVSLLEQQIDFDRVRAPLKSATEVWAGSHLCADIARRARADVRVLPYGMDRVPAEPLRTIEGCLEVGVFGSIELRKGQDLALAGLAALDASEREHIRLRLIGRVLDREFARRIRATAARLPQASFERELDARSYRRAISQVDAVLVSSREDTLPLVSIDALSAGRLLLLTRSVGTAAWLADGRDALIEPAADAAAMTRLLRRALELGWRAPAMGMAAHTRFAENFSRDAFLRVFYSRIEAVQAGADG